MEELLEPELVDLVDHDEEHLVVLRPVGARSLEREEFLEAEVAGVGDRCPRAGWRKETRGHRGGVEALGVLAGGVATQRTPSR